MDISYLAGDDQRTIAARVARIDDDEMRAEIEAEIEAAVSEWAQDDPDGRNDYLARQLDATIEAILARAEV